MADPSVPQSQNPAAPAPATASESKPAPKKAPAPGAVPAVAAAAAIPTPSAASAAHPPSEPAHPGVSLAPTGIAAESDVRTHSPGAAAPGGKPQPAGPGDDLGELPSGYEDGRLVCLVRDPSCAYVYWDLSRAQIDQAFGGLGAARAVLKLWSLKGELVREVEVHLEARGWYLRELAPGSELRVELWALGEKGARMLRAARPLRLPPAAPSDELDEHYLNLPASAGLPAVVPPRPKPAAPSPAPLPSWSGGTPPTADPQRELPWSGTVPPLPTSGGKQK